MERKEHDTENVGYGKQGKDQSQTKEKSVIALGDSMVKHLNGYGILWKLPFKCKNYVCNFPGAKRRYMEGYLKLSLCENPEDVILHEGTNDLNSEQSPELIAKSITDLAA